MSILLFTITEATSAEIQIRGKKKMLHAHYNWQKSFS